jgi:hypothetical protein
MTNRGVGPFTSVGLLCAVRSLKAFSSGNPNVAD